MYVKLKDLCDCKFLFVIILILINIIKNYYKQLFFLDI